MNILQQNSPEPYTYSVYVISLKAKYNSTYTRICGKTYRHETQYAQNVALYLL